MAGGSVRDIYGTLKIKDETKKPLNDFEKNTDESTESIVGMQDALKALGGVAVIGALKALAGEMITAFATLETQQTRMKNMAGDDYPALIGSINEAIEASQGLSNEGDLTMAVNQAKKYGASVELITGSLSQLQQLSTVAGLDLGMTMQGLAKDIASGSTELLQQNPVLVKHIDQFRKLGAGYDEATKKRRELFILDVLQKESIAINEQYNRTLEDTNALLDVSASQWGNIKERIGGMLAEGLKPLLAIANDVLRWLGETEEGLALLKFALITVTPLIGTALVVALYMAASAAWAFVTPWLPFIAVALLVGAAIAGIIFFIQDLMTWLDGGESMIGDFIDYVSGAVFGLIDLLESAWEGFKSFMSGIVDGIVSVLKVLWEGFKLISGITIIQTIIESLSDGGGLDGARAAGGPVRAGGSYLVGEEGPEIFTPSQSGAITPNGAGGAVSISVGPFYVSGGVEAAQEVENAVLDALNRLSDTVFRNETGVPVGS